MYFDVSSALCNQSCASHCGPPDLPKSKLASFRLDGLSRQITSVTLHEEAHGLLGGLTARQHRLPEWRGLGLSDTFERQAQDSGKGVADDICRCRVDHSKLLVRDGEAGDGDRVFTLGTCGIA